MEGADLERAELKDAQISSEQLARVEGSGKG